MKIWQNFSKSYNVSWNLFKTRRVRWQTLSSDRLALQFKDWSDRFKHTRRALISLEDRLIF
jgi:hypothetical protein